MEAISPLNRFKLHLGPGLLQIMLRQLRDYHVLNQASEYDHSVAVIFMEKASRLIQWDGTEQSMFLDISVILHPEGKVFQVLAGRTIPTHYTPIAHTVEAVFEKFVYVEELEWDPGENAQWFLVMQESGVHYYIRIEHIVSLQVRKIRIESKGWSKD